MLLNRIRNDAEFKSSRTRLALAKDQPLYSLTDGQKSLGSVVTDEELEDVLSAISNVLRTKR